MSRRILRVGLAGLLLLVMAACGGDEGPSSAPDDCTRIEDSAFTLVGQDLAWDVDCLRVPAGTDITFTEDNRDRGVKHNLSVFGPSGGAKTELESGPITQTLDYDATTAGYHQFVCDIHPSMEGDLWVDPPG